MATDATTRSGESGTRRCDVAGITARERNARQMKRNLVAIVAALAAMIACSSDQGVTDPGSPTPQPEAKVLLKEIVIDRLPSPFYHFDYDAAGTVKNVSYASGLTNYDVIYTADGRIKELQNNILVNRDRLVYAYDSDGRVAGIRYVDANGVTFTTVFLTYENGKLKEVERSRAVPGGFIIDKVTTLSYYPDGNLMERTERRPKIDGVQDQATTVDRFEGYDGGINVDGFSLIHDDFFDHLVLLPGVVMQKTNPRREIRSGDGVNYTVDYSYEYDGAKRPLSKQGALTITNGVDAGRKVQTRSEFSYY
jgi:hypothetical protein